MPPRNLFLSPQETKKHIYLKIIKIKINWLARLRNINVFPYVLYGKCLTRNVAINEEIITGSARILSNINSQIASPVTSEHPASR